MYVCLQCKKEMMCLKNGVGADYGHGHVYPGDSFVCKSCGIQILATNRGPIFDPEYSTQDAYIKMKEDK